MHAANSRPLLGRHVLVLNWRDSWHPEAGGSEFYVEQMARGLVEAGASVTMLSPRYTGARRRETVDGIDYVRYGGRLTVYLLVPLLALLGRLPRHDVAVEVQNGMPFLASAYLRGPVVVLVHHVHREQWPILFSRRVARFGWWLESRVAPWVARHSSYITVSEATRRELVGLGVDDGRITIVHNGSPERGDWTESPRAASPAVIVLGRLVPHKRVELAIDAVADLSVEFPDLTLDVVGEGWWHTHLVDHARERGVLDRVRFHGHVSDEEKHRLLARAWVSAVPSVKEGWGLVIVEAGLHETPSIAFRAAGGVAESVVDNETGYLVNDPDELAGAIGLVLRDPAVRDELGRMARKHARSFSWSGSQDRFAQHLVSLV